MVECPAWPRAMRGPEPECGPDGAAFRRVSRRRVCDARRVVAAGGRTAEHRYIGPGGDHLGVRALLRRRTQRRANREQTARISLTARASVHKSLLRGQTRSSDNGRRATALILVGGHGRSPRDVVPQSLQRSRCLPCFRVLRQIAITSCVGLCQNVHQGGKNDQRTILAWRGRPYGFGHSNLPRLRGRVLVPSLLKQRV